MIELLIVPKGDPFEYWCERCRQLRLSCESDRLVCGNCGAPIKLKGEPGALDAEELRGRAG
jgi:hypothetical protein